MSAASVTRDGRKIEIPGGEMEIGRPGSRLQKLD
jgi:hypothetical protein